MVPLPQPTRLFALCYVLAMWGAFIAFMPLGALILPQKVARIAGTVELGGPVRALSWLLVAGGIMAGVGNIAAGYVSDRLDRRWGSRRQMITIGLIGSAIMLAAIGAASSFGGLLLAVLVFQLTLNILLAPLVALMVDYVPDHRKGAIAGWLGLALPAGSLSVSVLVAAGIIGPTAQATIACLMVTALVAPLVWLWPVPERVSAVAISGYDDHGGQRTPGLARNFALAWVTRLLIQFTAAAILPYLYFYVADIARPGASAAAIAQGVGTLAFAFAVASIAGALGAGWWSDRLARRQPVLVTTSGAVAVAMLLLATMSSWPLIVAAYGLFAAALAGFLAVDGAFVAQLISGSGRRATLLGVMNLANTLPSMMAPAATLLVTGDSVDATGLPIVLEMSAAGALIAAYCSSRIVTPQPVATPANERIDP